MTIMSASIEARSISTQLRKLLERVLLLDSEFDAFVLDNWPDIKKRFFANGHDRVTKTNILIECVDCEIIMKRLNSCYPHFFKIDTTEQPSYSDENLPTEVSCSKALEGSWEIHIDIKDKELPLQLFRFLEQLKLLTGDIHISIKRIPSGSIRIKGKRRSLEIVRKLYKNGQIDNLLGLSQGTIRTPVEVDSFDISNEPDSTVRRVNNAAIYKAMRDSAYTRSTEEKNTTKIWRSTHDKELCELIRKRGGLYSRPPKYCFPVGSGKRYFP